MTATTPFGLETKFCRFGEEIEACEGGLIAGYASLFGQADQGGDVVHEGAYRACLSTLKAEGRSVKMLWQHDPAEPIGVWDEIREDAAGLFVQGRLLPGVRRGAEALALIQAGAIDGLSIGYRTRRAENTRSGRILHEIELWEVSLVTFPMLPGARASASVDTQDDTVLRALSDAFAEARADLA